MVIELGMTILLVCVVLVRWRQQSTLIAQLAHEKHRAQMLPYFSRMRFVGKYLIALAACGAFGVALMRPRREHVITQHQKGREVMVVFDVSRSMLTQDCTPSRLVCAQKKIRRLLDGLGAERVGLMIFAGAPCVLCPFTTDYDTFLMFLDDISPDAMSASATSLVSALRMVKDRFDAQATVSSRIAVVVTDGEDFSDPDPHLMQCLKDAGIRVATFMFGTADGGPIPDPDHPGSYLRDEAGDVVISRRDDAHVQTMMTACGGRFVPADMQGDRDVDALLAWIKLSEGKHQEVQTKVYDEWYAYPAACAIVLLGIEWFL